MRSQPTTRPDRARDRIHLDPVQKNRRADVARWALSCGYPLNIDAATIIIATRGDDVWTTSRVMAFLWETVREFCSLNQVPVPATTAETLYTYLRYLHAHQLLPPESDPFTSLTREARDNGGLTDAGRQQSRFGSPPAGGEVRPFPPERCRNDAM